MISIHWWLILIVPSAIAVAAFWCGQQYALHSVDADMDELHVALTKTVAHTRARKPCIRCGALARDDAWAIQDRWTMTDDGWICRWCAGDVPSVLIPDVRVLRFAIADSRVIAFSSDAGDQWTVTQAITDRWLTYRSIPAIDMEDALKVARFMASQELCEVCHHARWRDKCIAGKPERPAVCKGTKHAGAGA